MGYKGEKHHLAKGSRRNPSLQFKDLPKRRNVLFSGAQNSATGEEG